ncbi:MAG: FtsX-like permease family protein [Prevotella sp.]|nr:FtsX-like permease family protein [Prevotella sp.]MBR0187553.1 FtsX-like permease family protein [Prevotella sp.]
MKSYFRFLSRNKLYTLINVVGLVVSLTFVILLGDYTWRQYSIDSWHKNADRIVLVGSESSFALWPDAAAQIKDMCPEIEQKCCVMSSRCKIRYHQLEVKDDDKGNGSVLLVDSTFFQFFDFELEAGDRRTALDAPNKCVITERLAKRLFGDKDPIGEPLQIMGDREVDPSNTIYDSTLVYTVSAVAKNLDYTALPNETQVIASAERFPQIEGYKFDNYGFAYSSGGSCKSFFMLRPGMTLDSKKKTINDFIAKNYPPIFEEFKVSIVPLKDIMFAPQNDGKGVLKGDKTRLRIMLAAVLAILFFAISNYINLTVANTGFRAKEMATRRLFGSSQHRISLELIAESTLMVAVSFAIGLALAFIFEQDAANLFKGKIALADDINIGSVSICLGFILLVGIISGVLPSWQMSRFQPIDIVKGNFRFRSKMVLGRLFIVLQNVITVTMLTASLVIWLQLNHLIHAPLGYNTKNLYYVDAPQGKSQMVRNKLEKMPFVERIGELNGAAFTSSGFSVMIGIMLDGNYVSMFATAMDSTAFNLYGLELLKDYGNNSDGYYINEAAKRRLALKDDAREMPMGADEKVPLNGIIKEFHNLNVLHEADPYAIQLLDHVENPSFLVKTNGDKQAKAAFIDMMRELDVPEEQLEWYVVSMEEDVAKTFVEQQNTLKIITIFTLIAVIISILGTIGMSLFFIRQRQKEISIRKVMGSTSAEVLLLMLRIFSIPLLIAFVVAVPLSWYVMTDWLSNFSYRIALSAWIFVAAGFTCFIISLLTVVFQSWRAASENPVNNIKTE